MRLLSAEEFRVRKLQCLIEWLLEAGQRLRHLTGYGSGVLGALGCQCLLGLVKGRPTDDRRRVCNVFLVAETSVASLNAHSSD